MRHSCLLLFQNDAFLEELRYNPTTYETETFKTSYGRRTNQVFIRTHALYHEKATLETREVTKLHYRDSTSSNDEFSSYAKSIKLMFTRSTAHLVTNETLDLYYEGTTLSKFIHEGRPTTTKPTFVSLRAR